MDRFPHGIVLKKKEGTVITVESQQFRLTRLISERLVNSVQERVAVFEGQRQHNQESVVLKLRLQLDPLLIEESDRPEVREEADGYFKEECLAVKKCEATGHTPIFYGSAELLQDNTDVFPSGYLLVLAMSRVPGRAVTDISDLTEGERSIIRQQLTSILEGMRLQGVRYDEGSPEQVFYDRGNGQTYLTGFAGSSFMDPSDMKPITESSVDVIEFGI